ncbi:MAG TPA: intradiol ring-cleavage dioxygenase [Casimicrobiaceae bacterium]|nr:intradiol ring-cleavage dioxygenase [Casimicrobiaceae bacterium]
MNEQRYRVARRRSRREALSLIGALSLLPFDAVRGADMNPPLSCIATPTQTEGPYFVDEHLNRVDIRSDPLSGIVKEGVPLKLRLFAQAIAAGACTPLAGAVIDVWHCDAAGVYSDVNDAGANAVGQKFLRGYQLAGNDGGVEFLTIYPGWYQGRTAHIHFKIRGQPAAARSYAFTSQLYFDEAISDRVYARAPYAKGAPRTRNDADFIYRGGGKQLTLALIPDGSGYAARFDVGLRMA